MFCSMSLDRKYGQLFSPAHHRQYLRTCERCHKNKEKCNLIPDQLSCSRCHRLRKACVLRPRRRMGRKPLIEDLPHGTISIMSLEYEAAADLPLQPTFRTRKAHGASLYRSDTANSNLNRLTSMFTISRLHIGASLPISCPQITKILLTREGFFEAHRQFIVCQEFVEDFQSTVLLLFHRRPKALADAYFALLELMSRSVEGTSLEGIDFSLGTRCLRSLIHLSSSITDMQDAAVVVMLGQTLLAYNALMPLGSSTRTITRATLSSTKDWYSAMCQQPELDPVIIAPVLVDTVDCLLRREMPVLRLPYTQRCVIDRFSGVCSPILPLLYDLCECSHRAKNLSPDDSPTLLDFYSDIEERLNQWRPWYPPGFSQKFTEFQITAMSAQAYSYRLAALLIIHRLRYPIGIEDATALKYATEIVELLAPLQAWPSKDTTGLLVDFPLLVAMMEDIGSAEKIFLSFEPLRYRKRQSCDALAFVRYVKEARQSGYQGLWLDLVGKGFGGDFLP